MPQQGTSELRVWGPTVARTSSAVTIDGGARRSPPDSISAQISAEATHVDGALAAHKVRFAWVQPPIAVGPGGAALKEFSVALHDATETLAGSGTGTMIQILQPDDTAAGLDSMEAGIAAPASPRGFLDPLWLATRSNGAGACVALASVAWADPASVTGAAVMMIGAATLVVSNWPAPIP